MRIIAGEARGRKLDALPGSDIRPTSDRVREALFNVLGPKLEACRFLDVFAGTGANGIEALSRGAVSATFVDEALPAIYCVRANLLALKYEGRARLMRLKLPSEATKIEGKYDIIFADPPYNFKEYESLLLGLENVVAEDGILVVEHHHKVPLPAELGRLLMEKDRRYGETKLSYYHLREQIA